MHILPHPHLIILAALLLAACTSPTAALLPPTQPPTVTSTPITPSPTPLPSATPEPPTPTITATPTLAVCSPLAGYSLADLPAMVSNPFFPPEPGSDNPHQGVDLAIIEPTNRIALSGNPVQAILDGQVVMLVKDRFPYGNAVMIETSLEKAGPEWWAQAGIPTPAPTLAPHSALTCPGFTQPPAGDLDRRSVYVLYAHLQSIAELSVGQPVTCGQALGVVGMSGNALNPHLHVEIRAAPGGMQLGSMAHYDSSASQDEQAAYCLWRVSGLFQLVDPLNFMWPGSSKK